ncbi:MAG: DNA polymerase [Candidatus Methanomethylicaceae archaeon]
MRVVEAEENKKFIWRDSSPDSLPGFGSVPAEIMIVGLSPSTKRPESRKLLPFGSRFFPILEIFESIGSVYTTNLTSIPHDPGEKISSKEIKKEGEYLAYEIELVDPKVIVTMSQESARYFCSWINLHEDHGTYVVLENQRILLPTYHPRAVLQSSQLKSFFQQDLKRLEWLKSAQFRVKHPEYLLNAPISDLNLSNGSSVVLDIETRGLYGEIELVGLRANGRNYLYTPETLGVVREILKNYKLKIIGHNLSYDLAVLLKNQILIHPESQIFDTMIAAYLAGEQTLSLKSLAVQHSVEFPGSRAFSDLRKYLSLDLEGTELLYSKYSKEVEPKKLLWKVMMRWVIISARTYATGVYIQKERIPEVLSSLHQTLEQIRQKWGINLNSSQQLSKKLLQLGIKLPKTEKGSYSTSEAVLSQIERPEAQEILQYRASTKLAQFLEQYLQTEDSFLRPRLKPWGTQTGRFSCEDPNLQQVPREGLLKTLFTSRFENGRIFLVDLSQAELRVAALITGDQKMIQALCSSDVHRYIASVVFRKPQEEITSQERKWAKRVVFGVLYGGTPSGLSEKFGIPKRTVQEIYSQLMSSFPGLHRYITEIQENPPRHVITLTGRVRDLSELFPENLHAAIRRAINTPIQSLASDLMLTIGAEADATFARSKMKARVYFPIHDSIYMDLPKEEVKKAVEIIGEVFLSLPKHKELSTLPFDQLPIIGEGAVGLSWASVESTNEHYDPELRFEFSTQFGAKEVK